MYVFRQFVGSTQGRMNEYPAFNFHGVMQCTLLLLLLLLVLLLLLLLLQITWPNPIPFPTLIISCHLQLRTSQAFPVQPAHVMLEAFQRPG